VLKNTAKNRCSVQNAIKYSCAYKNDPSQDPPMIEGTLAGEEKNIMLQTLNRCFAMVFSGCFEEYYCFRAATVCLYIACVERFVSHSI